MTPPPPRFVACRCSHEKGEHDGELAPQCHAKACTCLQYRPATATRTAPLVPSVTVSTLSAPVVQPAMSIATAEQLLAAAKRSRSKRTVALGVRVAELVLELRGRLALERAKAEQQRRAADEREAAKRKAAEEKAAKAAQVAAEKAAARAEVERLRKQLAEARAKLSPGPRAGDGTCPDCGKGALSNVGVHRAKAHGFRRNA